MKHFISNFIVPLIVSALATCMLYYLRLGSYEGAPVAIVAFLFAIAMYLYFLKTKKEFPWPIMYPELSDTRHKEEHTVLEPELNDYQKSVLYAQTSRQDLKKARYVGLLILLLTFIIVFIYSYAVIANGFHTPKKGIQGGALLLSLGIAVIYYLYNREKFETFPQRMSFFSACAIGPPSVIEFLF